MATGDWLEPRNRAAARVELALTAADVGTFDHDLVTGEVDCDERLLALFGIDPAGFDRRAESFMSVIVPEDVGAVEEAISAATAAIGEYSAEYRVRRPDGSVRWIEGRGRVFPGPGGEARHMVGVALDSTAVRHARDTVARTLEHMADGFLTVDPDWRITYANHNAERALGCARSRLVGRSLWDVRAALVPPGEDRHFREAAATGDPRTYEVYAVGTDRWHQVRIFPSDEGLSVYITDISARRARELERAHSAGRPDQARRILEYSQALAEADTVEQVTAVIARRLRPAFGASGLLISVAESGRLRLVGHAGYQEAAVRRLDGLGINDKTPIVEVTRTRSPLFLPTRCAYLARYPDLADLCELTGKQAWAFLPMVVSGRSLGTLTLSFDEEHPFLDDERSLLVTLAGLLAQTLERSRLRDAERALAAALQRGMLPGALPDVQGVSVRARYLPATEGIEVGGDWYDVIALPGGDVALVVGDVQGHNVAAAAVMGQLRNALRAYAAEGHDPAAVVGRTNRLVAELDGDRFATCCYVQVDPTTLTAYVVRAGHLPPLRRSSDGSVRVLDTPGGLPLGVDVDEEYAVTTVALDPGELLLLYTDGLVEASDLSLDSGVARLHRLLGEAGSADPVAVADAVVQPARDSPHRADDIAVLVARVDGHGQHRPPAHVLELLEGELAGVPVARRFVREALAESVGGTALDTAVLLTNELVTNALLHARGDVRVGVRADGGVLRVEVSDGLASTPRLVERSGAAAGELSTGGRGLAIVASLADRWGTAPRGDGKSVWFELGRS